MAKKIIVEAEIGLVNKVVPAGEVVKEAREWAALMAEKRPDVLAAAKRALDFGETHGMEEAMRNEERASAELRKTRGR